MHHRAIYASFGASSGFSGAALWEWLMSPSTASGLAFVGSTASTVVGWLLAQRSEINRARLEREKEDLRARLDREKEDRDQARHQEYLDALNAATIKRIESGEAPPLRIARESIPDGSTHDGP
jgi:hypothetical protein